MRSISSCDRRPWGKLAETDKKSRSQEKDRGASHGVGVSVGVTVVRAPKLYLEKVDAVDWWGGEEDLIHTLQNFVHPNHELDKKKHE